MNVTLPVRCGLRGSGQYKYSTTHGELVLSGGGRVCGFFVVGFFLGKNAKYSREIL